MRRSGKTTRKVDEAVQKFFENGAMLIPNNDEIRKGDFNGELKDQVIIDPDVEIENPNMCQHELKYRIVRRLEIEHHNQFQVNGNRIKLKS